MMQEVKDAVFGNVGSIISFRTSADDARVMLKYFEPKFEEHDLVHMHNRHFAISMTIAGEKVPAFSAISLNLPPFGADYTEQIVAHSRAEYAQSREYLERYMHERYEAPITPSNPNQKQSGPPKAGPKPQAALSKPQPQIAPSTPPLSSKPVTPQNDAPERPKPTEKPADKPAEPAAVAGKKSPLKSTVELLSQAVLKQIASDADEAGGTKPKRKRTRKRKKKSDAPTAETGERAQSVLSQEQRQPRPLQSAEQPKPRIDPKPTKTIEVVPTAMVPTLKQPAPKVAPVKPEPQAKPQPNSGILEEGVISFRK